MSDAERATKLKEIDTKEKRLNHEAEDAQTAYNADLQEAYGKIAAKVSAALKKYVSDNGYTLLLDVSSQQSNVMWANQSTDVTQAVVTAYNTSSGVAAPVPSAPSAPAARPSAPTTTQSQQRRSNRLIRRRRTVQRRGGDFDESPLRLCCSISSKHRSVEKLVDRRVKSCIKIDDGWPIPTAVPSATPSNFM